MSTLDHGDAVELAVSDDGPGLPRAELELAAGRFWRGQGSVPGTGLGLAIAREIVAGHGGSFRVDAAAEGGLLVRFGLPAATEKP